MLLLGLVSGLFWFRGLRQRHELATDRCRTSIRILLGAIELYRAAEHRPPERLEQLVPRYLEKIPDCPVAKKPTYHYEVYGEKFSLFCRGHYHERENHPVFNSVKGWD